MLSAQDYDPNFLARIKETKTHSETQQNNLSSPSDVPPTESITPNGSSSPRQNDPGSALLWLTDILTKDHSGVSADIETAKRLVSTQKHKSFFPSDLPCAESAIFKDSSFFHRNGSTSVLPSPTEVLAEARRRGLRPELDPLHYPLLGLTVKHGYNVFTTEGQCLWAVRKSLGDVVPVPEVYGWTKEEGVSYIYMEYIPGDFDFWDCILIAIGV